MMRKQKAFIGFDQIVANYVGCFVAVWEELEAARGDAVKKTITIQ